MSKKEHETKEDGRYIVFYSFEDKFPSFVPDASEPKEPGGVFTPTALGRGYAGVAHFHVEFYSPNRTADKLKYLAGSETGATRPFVVDALPEQTADTLRRAVEGTT